MKKHTKVSPFDGVHSGDHISHGTSSTYRKRLSFVSRTENVEQTRIVAVLIAHAKPVHCIRSASEAAITTDDSICFAVEDELGDERSGSKLGYQRGCVTGLAVEVQYVQQ
ncbi:hypothetical protein PAPYR_8807 [Paratrimastix pyriformis]|uniref:Uncharacterized protein n=1 Tax=Paratrimastix pyriformis TaxID=342808 RepID=A0ABQ8U9Y0_9EUKA|nr:hypothetical protein PAPYR_8807 [Paratrimastix pyriformis]